MKFVFLLLVALLGAQAVFAQDIEEIEPETFFIGERLDEHKLVNMYYGDSEETAERSTHSVTIDWETDAVQHIRFYVYAASSTQDFTTVPANSGRITVTATDVTQLVVVAHMYG